ncbi:MAG: hypothetical protein FJ390_01510 [Verrucomicrobia bacterium]|nr:hypothetical protein [Verrucomicrobiota bacterium]
MDPLGLRVNFAQHMPQPEVSRAQERTPLNNAIKEESFPAPLPFGRVSLQVRTNSEPSRIRSQYGTFLKSPSQSPRPPHPTEETPSASDLETCRLLNELKAKVEETTENGLRRTEAWQKALVELAASTWTAVGELGLGVASADHAATGRRFLKAWNEDDEKFLAIFDAYSEQIKAEQELLKLKMNLPEESPVPKRAAPLRGTGEKS